MSGGGFGVIDSMIKSYKNNNALLGRKKSLKELHHEHPTAKSKIKKFQFRKASPQEKLTFKLYLKKEKRRKDFVLAITFVLTCFIAGMIFYWILY